VRALALACAALLLAGPGPARSAGTAPLSLTWEAQATERTPRFRDAGEDSVTRAVLTLRNLDAAPLPPSGWSIWFSSMKGVSPAGVEGADVIVEHVQGTLYRLRPDLGFAPLAPGQSRRIRVRHYGVASRADLAIAGPYLVRDSAPGTGLPLEQFEAIEPGQAVQVERPPPSDLTPWPTPETRYARFALAGEVDPASLPAVLPTPRHAETRAGELVWDAPPEVHAAPGLEFEVALAHSLFEGRFPDGRTARPPTALRLDVGPVAGEDAAEAYELTIDPVTGVAIRGASAAAVSRALQSLRQMLSPGAGGRGLRAPAVFLRDAPRFPVRALLIDLARNFQDRSVVLHELELMARYKLNVLHLHLTDDDGWRIEIPGIAELTTVGARRAHDTDPLRALPPMFGSGPSGHDPHGSGFLSEGDYAEILRRAQALRIEVIPEIEMPGHARAAIVAMKARAARIRAAGGAGADELLLTDPADRSVYRSKQNFDDNVLDPGLPSTYRFIERVVDALQGMHRRAGVPLRTVHMGGDEVPAGAWERSPACLELMRRNGYATRQQVWEHFYGRVLAILQQRGLTLSGWEELGARPGSAEPDARAVAGPAFLGRGVRLTVWNDLDENKDLGNRLANGGYDVVLAPATHLYFDLAYSRDPAEPGHDWATYVDLQDAFDVRPFDILRLRADEVPAKVPMEALTPEGRRRILGLEGAMWSETMRDPGRIDFMLLPRMFALAERAWVPEPAWERGVDAHAQQAHALDWSRFAALLGMRVLPRLEQDFPGIHYHISPPGLHREAGTVVAIAELPGTTLRYTTDGSEPTAASAPVLAPIAERAIVRVAAFDRAGHASRASTLDNR
jgi:hexosaminidase